MLSALIFTAALLVTDGASQFDLVCTGTMTSGAFGGRFAIPENARPWSERYRIDLDNKLWCYDRCSSVLPLVEVNAGQLVLMRMVGDNGTTIRIDRTTGEALHLLQTPSQGATIYVRSEGSCERAPFTAFPSQKF